MMKNNRILITGGAGVIGRELINLVKNDNDVYVVDIKENPNLEGITYDQLDLSRDDLSGIISFEPEFIFHLAAVFERAEESANFWNINYQNNTLLSHRMVDLSLHIKSLRKFVFASSYLIYDKSQYTFTEQVMGPKILRECDKVSPRNVCGASKYYTENELEYIKKVHDVKYDSVSARIYRVYGKGSNDVISRWIRACIQNDEIKLWGIENSFDYIHARDVAHGLVKLASCQTPSIVNLGSGVSHTIGEVIQILKANYPQVKIDQLSFSGPYEKSQADTSILYDNTNWTPEITLESGIHDIISWEEYRMSTK